MALPRLALRNLQTKAISLRPSVYAASAGAAAREAPPALCGGGSICGNLQQPQPTTHGVVTRGFASNSGSSPSSSKEIATKSSEKSLNKRQRKKPWRSPWNAIFPPRRDFMEIFPSGLGYALLNASQNINKLLESLNIRPSTGLQTWKLKEKDCSYQLRFQVPGLKKEDLKITVDDGFLHITGEHSEEEEEGEKDEFWSAKWYGLYDTSLELPEDAKVDEIKAELKNGVLNIVIPRDPEKARKEDVKEIHVAG